MFTYILILLAGVALLYYGSEWLVDGSSYLAYSFAIRPLIVGLTIVAFATSAPELLVSLIAAAKDSAGISVGNILGSNVINIALVLGLSAMINPLQVEKGINRFEVPYMIGASVLFWVFSLDGVIGRIDGAILFSGLIFFIIYSIIHARDNSQDNDKVSAKLTPKTLSYNIFFIITGLIALALGAHCVVKSAVFIARIFGLSEIFIGISIVAVGTSLPELATSVAAQVKNESDISIGNVVGSNIFNVCMVMGLIGMLKPIKVDTGLSRFEFPFMLLISFLFYIFLIRKKGLTRVHGVVFTVGFFIYIGVAFLLNS